MGATGCVRRGPMPGHSAPPGPGSSAKQAQQLLPREARGRACLGERGAGERALLLLEGEDALFDGLCGHESVDEDGLVLADAVRAVGGLLLDGRVPPWVEQEDVEIGRAHV